MTDALENKAVEILDKSQATIATFSDKMVELAKQYGPDVADAALQMARVDAAQGLVKAAIILIASSAAMWLAWYLYKLEIPFKQNEAYSSRIDDNSEKRFFKSIAAIIIGISSSFVFVSGMIDFCNLWRWVGIFEPKLWLAKRVLGL